MRRFLLALLLLSAFGAQAAVPVVSCTAGVTNSDTDARRTAPLFVPLDCTATTDADLPDPDPGTNIHRAFRELEYRVNFGDTAIGDNPTVQGGPNWANGANTALSKNQAMGAVSWHIYQTPGTYTWTVVVSDGTSTRQVTGTITVTDPDDTFSTANTTCINSSGSDFTGCPLIPGVYADSATCVANSRCVTQAAFQTAISTYCNAATKRCAFKREDQWTATSAAVISSAGPILIEAFGTGAKPRINLTASVNAIAINNAAVDDVRIVDFDFVGAGGAGAEVAISFSANVAGVTILRPSVSNMGGGGFVAGGNPSWTLTTSVIQEGEFVGNYSTNIFVRLISGAVLGNSVSDYAGTENVVRFMQLVKSGVSHNTIRDVPSGKCLLTMRALAHVTAAEDSYYFIASDNYLLQGTGIGTCLMEANPNAINAWLYDFILERNWVVAGPYTGGTAVVGIKVVSGRRGYVRNNIIDLNAPIAAGRSGVTFSNDPASQTSIDMWANNNTVYNQTANIDMKGVHVQAGVVDSVVKNNLCWFITGTGEELCLKDQGTTTAFGTNSGDIGTVFTDPAFDGPLTTPFGFRIDVDPGSYAAKDGTAIFPASNSDFFRCDDTTANEHIGAAIPRARARCR